MSDQAHIIDEGGGGAISLERAVNAVRRRLHVVAIVAGLVVGLTTAFVLWIPNRYEGIAVVQIDPRKKTISNIENVIADMKADAATIDSEVEIIAGRAIALKVIDVLKLREDEEFKKPAPLQKIIESLKIGRFLASEPSAPEPLGAKRLDGDPIGSLIGSTAPGTFIPERDEVATAFSDRLRVARVRSTLLIEIKFSSEDPVKAARIANTVAEVYLADQLAGKKEASGFATGLLEQKLDEMKGRVADAERKVALFKSDNNIFDSEGQLLSEKELARLMEQTVTARNATAEAKAKFENAQRLATLPDGTATIADVLDSNTIRVMKEALALARKRAAELETRYGPRHPEMQKVRAEVGEAEEQLSTEVGRLVANLKNDYLVAERREMQMKQALTTLKEQEAASKEASVRLMELQQEATTSKQLFEALLVRYKQTSETQELQLPDARIVEQADVPLFPAAPKRKQMVLLALIGGLILGIGLCLVLEFATPGVSHPDDVERNLDVAHIASVPAITADGASLDPMHAIRLVLAEPRGIFAESVRGIRRELDVRHRSGKPRVVLVASSLPGEGAELIASNLAHHYALTGHRVLLVDGDLRRAPLTRQLAPQRGNGLLDVLVRGLPVESAILHDASTGLHFLPAMSPTPVETARPEMLTSRQMSEVMHGLTNQFDIVIVDSPPLLPVVDGRILADYADQIVFVMTWRRTPKQLAKRALQTLGFNHQKVAGVVVNSVALDALEETYALGTRMPVAATSPRMRRAA